MPTDTEPCDDPSSNEGVYADVTEVEELVTPLPRDWDVLAAPRTPGDPSSASPARHTRSL